MLRKTLVSLMLVSLLIFSLSVITGAQSDEVIETDVVVIGGGGAGLSAAVEAANHGAEVVLLEKMPFSSTIPTVRGRTTTCSPQLWTMVKVSLPPFLI